MWIISVPLIIVLFVLVGIGAGISKALSVNIMPFFSIIFLIMAIVAAVNAFRCEEKQKMGHIIAAIVLAFLFLITVSASVTTGDILSWVWYHI